MKKIYFIASAMIAFSIHAQETKKESNIEEVTILGRKKLKEERREFSRHAQSVETLSEEDLNRNNPAMIDQTLSTMAGVQVDKRTNFGGQRVVVRGYGNDQKFNNWGTKFYLNGVPLTNADGVTFLEDIDFSLINNIEVIKGPASTMYGGGVGGTVRFYMRPTAESGTSVTEKLTMGSYSYFQNQTKVEAVTDNSSVMFNYGHLQSDGYRPRGTSLKNNYAFLGNFKINDKQSIQVYASHNYSNEGVSGQISYPDYYAGIDQGNFAYAKKDARNIFRTTRASVAHNWRILKNFSYNTSIFFAHSDYRRVAAGAFETSQNPNYGFRSVFNLTNSLGANFQNSLDFGAEYTISRSLISNYRFTGTNDAIPLQVSDISKASYFKYDNSQTSIFAVDRLTYNPWKTSILVGISGNTLQYSREDLLSLPGLVPNYGKDLSLSKKFPTVFTPHIALQKTYKNQIFNLSYSEGYNAPTATTAAISGMSSHVVNDQLLPERAKMWDFSIHGLLMKTRLDYQISVFNINVFDKLSQLKQGSITLWQNTGNQRNTGLEAGLGYLFNPRNGFLKKIEPYFNISYYDFRYRDFYSADKNTNYIHQKVVGVPRAKFSFGLDFETKSGIYLCNTYNYLGDVYTDFANTNLVKGFTLLNSKIGYKKSIGKWNIDAFLAGNNLTSQINYTFLFLGNNINDDDAGSQYFGIATTDVNPGPSKAYFFYGLNVKYKF